MRIEQLTFTRFIAAISIVFFHFGKPLNIFSQPTIHKLLIHANYGVSYFFILSGFVMMIAYGRKSHVHPISYLKNRFARIYPVYLLAIIFSLLYKFFFIYEAIPSEDILLNILALQAWVPAKTMTVNFPGWSLSVEFLFYAVFPLFCNKIYSRYKLKKLIFPILGFWLVSQLFFILSENGNFRIGSEKETHNFLFYFPLLHLNQFLIGNLAGLIFIKYFWDKQKKVDFAIIGIGILVILSILYRPENISYHNGLLAVLFAPLIMLIAMNSGFLTQIFNKKPLVYLGEISYGIYILQVPVYWFTSYCMLKAGIDGSLKIFLVYVSLLLFVSALSYSFIGTPLREKIKKTRIQFLN